MLHARRDLVDRRGDAAPAAAVTVAGGAGAVEVHDFREQHDHDAVPVAHDRVPDRHPPAVAAGVRARGRQHGAVVDGTSRVGAGSGGHPGRAGGRVRTVRAGARAEDRGQVGRVKPDRSGRLPHGFLTVIVVPLLSPSGSWLAEGW